MAGRASSPTTPRYGEPTTRGSGSSSSGSATTPAGCTPAGRGARPVRIALRAALRRHGHLELRRDAARFAAAVATLAEATRRDVMPDQTYLQQAQPSTFGHYLLSFAYPALRDAGRLRDGLDWVDRSPGGAGCVNGSRLLD